MRHRAHQRPDYLITIFQRAAPGHVDRAEIFCLDETKVVDSLGGDDRLRPASQPVDAGIPLAPELAPTLSLAGGPHLNGPAPDVGAQESRRFVFGDGFEG